MMRIPDIPSGLQTNLSTTNLDNIAAFIKREFHLAHSDWQIAAINYGPGLTEFTGFSGERVIAERAMEEPNDSSSTKYV